MTQVTGFNELSNCLVGKAMSKDQALSNKAKALELDKAIHAKNIKDSGAMLSNMAALVLTLPSGKADEDRLHDGILWPKGRNYRDEAKSSLIGSFKRWAKNKLAFEGKALKWDNESRTFTFKVIVEKSVDEKLEKLFPGLDQAHYTAIISLAAQCKAEIVQSVDAQREMVKAYRMKQAIAEDYALLTARGETTEDALRKVGVMNNVTIEDVQQAIGQ